MLVHVFELVRLKLPLDDILHLDQGGMRLSTSRVVREGDDVLGPPVRRTMGLSLAQNPKTLHYREGMQPPDKQIPQHCL